MKAQEREQAALCQKIQGLNIWDMVKNWIVAKRQESKKMNK
jgi:hypothetical protein